MSDIQDALGHLRQRVNVMTRHPLDDRLVILYDDHRWLLNVLFKIQKEGLLPGPPKLVFFDSHDDAGETRPKSLLLESLGVENILDATEKAFSAFVDYDIRTDDGNWLSVACELNLVSDVVAVGDKYSHNFEVLNGVYSAEDGTTHHLYNLSEDLDFELGGRGSLGDSFREEEFKGIRDFFDIKDGYHHARIGNIAPFILDFDLDFFTLNTNEGTLAWPLQIWEKHFAHYTAGNYFVKDLINKAEVITICREPDYCGSNGGIAGANYNLMNLDRYFFNGELGTKLLF